MKLVLSVVAFAGMAFAGKTYDLKLYDTAMVGGAELKAGEYRVEVSDNKAVIKGGKVRTETPVKVETVDAKYPTTTVRLTAGEKPQIKEIRLGGTKTKLIFSENGSTAGM